MAALESLSVRETADYLGTTERRVQTAVREGRLQAVKSGRDWRVVLDAQERVLFRADRPRSDWVSNPRVRFIGTREQRWPDDRLNPAPSVSGTRESELMATIEELKQSHELSQIAAATRVSEAESEIVDLRTRLAEEQRRRELGIRNALQGLVAMIPAPSPDEAVRYGISGR